MRGFEDQCVEGGGCGFVDRSVGHCVGFGVSVWVCGLVCGFVDRCVGVWVSVWV